MFRVASKPSK